MKLGICRKFLPGMTTTLLLLLLTYSNSVLAAPYSGGSGTSGDPYLIANVADLQALQSDSQTNAFTGKYFKQTATINLSEIANWGGIGKNNGSEPRFAGMYDGGGFSVSNMTISEAKATDNRKCAGLFNSMASGEVKNLAVTSASVIVKGDAAQCGVLVGSATSSTITNTYTTGSMATTTDWSGGDGTGGLVGSSNVSTISFSYSLVNVTSTRVVGGLVGVNHGTITNSFMAGAVSGGAFRGILVGDLGNNSAVSYVPYSGTGATNANGAGSVTPTKLNNSSLVAASVFKDSANFLTTASPAYFSSNWDFTNVWQINPAINNGYPILRIQNAAPVAPTVTTNAATSITTTGATLNGQVNDNGATTTVTFDYGLTTGYGAHVAATTNGTVNAGSGNTAVAKTLTGLTCGVTYHFRVNGVNSAGTTNGSDATFSTSACPAQTITVDQSAPTDAVYNSRFDVKAHASSGLDVAVTTDGVCSGSGSSSGNPGSPVTITMTSGTGTCNVHFDQAGNGSYSAAPQVTNSTTASKSTQSIIVTSSAPATAAYNTTFTVAAYASSALAVTYSSGSPTDCTNSGGAFTMIGSGICKVQYDVAGTSNFNPAPQVVENTAAITVVTIRTSPTGRAFTVDGTPYTTAQIFTWTPGSSHTIATTTPQTGSTGTRYTFGSWSDSGAMSHSITVPATATTYTATFGTEYQLTTAVTPATNGFVLPLNGNWYAAGSTVNVSVTPNTGSAFNSWSGPVANPNSAVTTATMTGPISVTANLSGIPALSVRVTGKSGAIDNRLWTLTVTNSGTGTATNVRLTGLSVTSPACNPVVKSGLPMAVADVTPVAPQTENLTIDFTGCAATAKFNVQFNYSYGSYTGSDSFYNLMR